MMMKLIRISLRIIATLIILIIIVAVCCIRPLDSSPYTENDFYKTMMKRLDSIPLSHLDTTWQKDKYGNRYPCLTHKPNIDATNPLSIGWSKVNLTPHFAVPTAGYGNRNGQLISTVHDSLWVRAFVVQNGTVKTAIVSCDLLIIPPEVTVKLKEELKTIGWSWQQVFMGATHTHNSMGAWGKRYIGELFAGKYDQNIVDFIAKSIVQSIQKAQQNVEPATYDFQKIDANEFVFNRLVKEQGLEDRYIRMMTFTKQNGKRASLVTFAAHSTTLSDSVMQISRDYNGILVDKLEREDGLEQAVFMAGCVGSMGPEEPEKLNDWQQASYLADGLDDKINGYLKTPNSFKINNLRMETIPLSMREPQWRVAENWCVRHWVWSWLYGDYEAEIKVLVLGSVMFVGLPCDFSGELIQHLEIIAAFQNLNLIVTSFNGGYVGYITDDKHYNLNKYETRVMNWFGPNNGAYFSEIVEKLIVKM
jgi:neutral ceramidase